MNIFELPVHPAADVFPMLDLDELADLAADIKANGLQHPVVVGVVDGVDMLIDGRNRLAACKMAGLEPEVKALNGQDPVSLILSENIHRRHMTTGQKAMSTAEALGFGYGKLSDDIFTSNFKAKISHSRAVIKFAPELVESVKTGATQLATAYEEAKHRKRAGNDDTDKLTWLKGEAPDLADKVIEGELTLAGAIAEHHERDRIAKANREAAMRNMRDGIYGFGTFFVSDERIAQAIGLLTEYRDEFETISDKSVKDSLRYLKAMESNIATLIKAVEAQ